MKQKLKDETIQSINNNLWIIERSSVYRAHNCQMLLTDERMNC
jgi:hypothetical protein